MDKDLLLEKYLLNSLDSAEREEFDQLMDQDEEFRKEVLTQERLVKGIRFNHLEDKMNMLKNLEEASTKKEKKGRIVNLLLDRRLAIAASITVIVAVGIWVFQGGGSSDLYNEYYTFLPATEVVRGDESGFGSALSSYNAKNFEEAEKALNNFSEVRAIFYRAICLMELGHYSQAAGLFQNYIDQNDNEPLPAEYYLGLCYVKLDDIEKAKEALNSVSESETYYFNRAQELVEALK